MSSDIHLRAVLMLPAHDGPTVKYLIRGLAFLLVAFWSHGSQALDKQGSAHGGGVGGEDKGITFPVR